MKTRKIPTPEEAHAPFAAALTRNYELNDTIAGLRRDAADLRQQLSEGDRVTREDRIESLANGTPFADPGPIRERLSEVLRQLQDAEDALARVTDKLRHERGVASRVVSEGFSAEHKVLLGKFWNGIAQAAGASLEIQELHRQLSRVGIEPVGLSDPAASTFDEPVSRPANLAGALRRAAAAGIIVPTVVPESLR